MTDKSALRIEAAHKTIADVFSDEYTFSIPAYQRPYAWEETQVRELLTDLTEAMSPESLTDGFYFLGSVVLVKEHGLPDARVVDGQQRLTTLTIIFSVLRDLTQDTETRVRRERYVKQSADDDRGLKEKLRLQLRKKDQSYFEKTVQKTGATSELPDLSGLTGSKARIVENALLVRKFLSDMDEQKRAKFVRFLLQNCYLVIVEVPTDMAARRIFTVLNARGLDLTATDILKADLLERAGDEQEDELSACWEDIETALGRDRFNDLFVHIRMIFQREKPRSALETGFPVHVPPFLGDPNAFVNDELTPYSEAFFLQSDPDGLRQRYGQQTANLIASLDRLDNKDWLPPLLLCLRQGTEGLRDDVPEFVFKLERLAYFLFVTRADVNARMARYGDVLNLLDPKEDHKLKSNGIDLTNDEVKAFFKTMDGPVYLATRVVKPLLLRIEQASTDGAATYDHSIISVEHVCPQNPKSGSDWDDWISNPEEHAELLHKLGNLVLLSRWKNSAASNYDFTTKKDTYFAPGTASAFIMTSEVRDESKWTPDSVRKRQNQVLARLAKSWQLQDGFHAWQGSDI